MSSSMASASASPAASTISNATGGTQVPINISASSAQFREIHKNTWLKRLTAEGKKVTVGPKRCDRSWVVFCVHDDTEALLEGYAEPRQAASHSPEWIVSMQDTLHISHALIPNSHEFEFVVTLSNEVIRFHAMSWEIMQEWVETLRSKLREMKILSPRENLYTKLPEIRAPLLPTRDPTSPLPAPPPVPAAIVPGVERVVPHSMLQETVTTATEINGTSTANTTARVTSTAQTINTSTAPSASNANSGETPTVSSFTTPVQSSYAHVMASHDVTALLTTSTILTSMSNTLTQNLLNMLSDPISTYSEHLNGENAGTEFASLDEEYDVDDGQDIDDDNGSSIADFRDEFLTPLLRKSSVNIQVLPLTSSPINSENSVRVDISATNRTSADQIKNLENLLQCDRLIPRPQTSRSLSAGAADASRKQITHFKLHHNETGNVLATSSSNNITEFEISSKSPISPDPITTTTATQTSTITTAAAATAPMAATTTDPKTNITIIQVSTNDDITSSNSATENDSTKAPKLPIKNITADIFKFPETHKAAAVTAIKTKQHEYKSNVQIIPSNLIISSTIQVLGQDNVGAAKPNQYSTPVKKNMQQQQQNAGTSSENNKITTVHVAGDETATTGTAVAMGTNTVSVYGTCYTSATSGAASGTAPTPSQTQKQFTPKLPKKIILSANTSGITNIAVNNSTDSSKTTRENTCTTSGGSSSSNSNASDTIGGCDNIIKHNVGNVHYEKVFLSSSIPITTQEVTTVTATTANVDANAGSTTSTNINVQSMSPKLSVSGQWNSPRRQVGVSSSDTQTSSQVVSEAANSSVPASPTPVVDILKQKQKSTVHTSINSSKNRLKSNQSTSAGAAVAQHVGGSPASGNGSNLNQPPLPTRPPFLTRGLTEAVITTRPSRRDVHFLKLMATKTKSHSSATSNNNGEMSSANVSALPVHAAVNRTNSESAEQHRRSSSTSDARNNTRGTNNNEFIGNRIGGGGDVAGASGGANASIRIQQPPQPFRSVESNAVGNGIVSGMSPLPASTANTNSSPVAKRMTLREQQVMQLRREIMHPGGVRLQLRRKDCVGSIAWVDAFGAVWVAGWKQKEHPVLYNALHIGDQLLSIAGISISTAAEANKIIRNSNTLFVEVLVRRIPFGRGYAIRREREGQCLGLIRDGNSSTIVDVVPNSLAARHGLPPKSQSCDGTTLTFWVLTEINGRPLNLFFKENEIRDRLNSVGRDISILVQPSDLITKLKKQLKSLRGYKDYLVQ